MAATVSFWQRVSSILRPGVMPMAHTDGNGRTVIVAGADDAVLSRAVSADVTGGVQAAPWWRRRQMRQAQTRAASLRVIALADALQQHFQQQDQRAAELGQALQRVGGTLEQLAATQHAQGQCLQTIAAHSEAAGKQAAALTDTLRRVPDSLLAQAEALRTVARHLDISQESDTQLMHSLQHFGQAVGTLSSAGTAQVETLQHLHAAQREQHEAFSALVREQSRRFMLMLFVAGLLALAGLAGLGITLALHYRL